jgi:hypothetical protein
MIIVFIHSVIGNITTNDLIEGMNAKKKRIISNDKEKVAQNPKIESDLEYLGSFNINILKKVIYSNPNSQLITAETPCINAMIGFDPQKAPNIIKQEQDMTDTTNAFFLRLFFM